VGIGGILKETLRAFHGPRLLTSPSIIEGNGKPELEKMSRIAGGLGDVSLKLGEAQKTPKITQIPQEPALVLEEDPQHLGDDEDHL
jgi:hypothetical protein